jgi:Rieske Fe-S protein
MNPSTIDPFNATRRQWVKQFMLCSAAALIGPRWSSSVLAEVTRTGPGAGVLRLTPSSFPALENPGGSIQLNFIQGIPPLTLNRVSEDRFVTLDSICTHAGCTVSRFIVANNRMRCPCHGSRYDIEGRVFRDANGISTEPASDDLQRYATSYDPASGIVAITIPDLSLHIESISVHHQSEDGSLRLKLVFPTTYGAVYEIYRQKDLASPLEMISFSATPAGGTNLTSVGPQVQGDFTAYVDATGPHAFFAVGLKLTEKI